MHITRPADDAARASSRQYLALKHDGLNTVEVDLKDESGNVSFTKGAPAIARDGRRRARVLRPARRSRGRRTRPACT